MGCRAVGLRHVGFRKASFGEAVEVWRCRVSHGWRCHAMQVMAVTVCSVRAGPGSDGGFRLGEAVEA